MTTIDLDTPNGPVVTYTNDHSIEDVNAELPEGWAVDYSSQITIRPGVFRAPLVQAITEPTYTTTEYFGSDSHALTIGEIREMYEGCGFGDADDLELDGDEITAPSDTGRGRVVMARALAEVS